MKKKFIVYTDGASRGNPGPGGWGAIVVDPEGETIELGAGAAATTNNAMELSAIVASMEWLSNHAAHDAQITIYSDSKYAIDGIQGWVFGWQRNGWQTKDGNPVKNKELWQDLIRLQLKIGAAKIKWIHVPGHADIPGNDRCDEIATTFADGNSPSLYSGPTKNYAIHYLPPSQAVLAQKSAQRKKTKQKIKEGYYVSLVRGEYQTHKTWGECEQMVKGVSGAKFKKVANAEDEAEIRAKWGLS